MRGFTVKEHRRRWAAVPIACAASLLLAGCGTGDPAYASIPASPATVSGCTFAQSSATADSGLVGVDRAPRDATAIWWPGPNAHPCRPVVTTLSSAEATRIATGINAAPRPAGGTTSCPAGQGIGVSIYFDYAHGRPQVVDISLDGCPLVSAPGRRARGLDAGLRQELLAIAPQGWRRYLHY